MSKITISNGQNVNNVIFLTLKLNKRRFSNVLMSKSNTYGFQDSVFQKSLFSNVKDLI